MALPYQGTLEANVGVALQRLKVDFIPQYSLDGGNTVRGGQIIDYVVYVPPQAIALYCQGSYWHSGGLKKMEDLLHFAAAQRRGLTPMEIWEDDYKTVELAQQWLVKNVV